MKLNIQLFGDILSWDELKESYNDRINTSQDQLNNLDNEKQTQLDSYTQNYNNQLDTYKGLMDNQKEYISNWETTQKENTQKQTDYNVGLVNENKEQAAKDTQKNVKSAYTEYEKANNPYGASAEQLASSGLSNSGYAESVQAQMFNTYQNRVSVAKESLMKANTEYDNQIQQALLNNDVKLAEISLDALKQQYQITLNTFEYTSNLNNQKLEYETNLNNTYYARGNDLQNRIDNYKSQIANINQYQEEYQMKKEQIAREIEQQRIENQQWKDKFEEEKRQYNNQMAENKRQFDYINGVTYDDNEKEGEIKGTKLSLSGSYNTSTIPGLNSELGLSSNTKGKIYYVGDKYYYYDEKQKIHTDITPIIDEYKKKSSSNNGKTTKFNLNDKTNSTKMIVGNNGNIMQGKYLENPYGINPNIKYLDPFKR